MRNNLRSAVTMTGRRMAGARSLWRANGMKDEQFGMPVIGIVNSFTQFVPGHTHLHEIGQYVKTLIEERGCFAAEFNTIAIDDGIAMGHDGMLYSLPSREIIADSVEYMANAHQVDALFCISNCDKITPGMLPRMRFMFGHVYSQLHELSQRSVGIGASRQRYHCSHPH